MNISWDIVSWAWPLLLVAAAAAWFWTVRSYRATDPPIGAGLRGRLIALRIVALSILLIAVARPIVSRLAVRDLSPVVAVIVEDSASMSIPDAGSGLVTAVDDRVTVAPVGPTRWDVAQRLAQAVGTSCERRDDEPEVTLLRGNGLTPVRPFTPSATAAPPVAVGTDLTALVQQVADRFAGRPLRAVILIADGNESITAAARSLPAARASDAVSGVAPVVRLVGVGDRVGLADRLLRDLRYPDVAYAGDEILIEVAVTHRYAREAAGQPITVRLRDGEQLLAEASGRGDGDLTRLELTFRPETEGLQVYELEVSPLVNERYLANNRATLAVNVRKERARLLVLAAEPGWDVRFLAGAAAREERLRLDVVYPGPGGFVLADSAVVWRPPISAAGWRHWDGVILTGWHRWLGNQVLSPLVEAVRDGLGLWLLPGPVTLQPGLAVRDPLLSLPPALAEIVPVEIERTRLQRGEWFVQATGAGTSHPVLDGVTGGVGAASQTLADLPPLVAVAPVRPRTDAVVLLRARPARSDTIGVPLLVLGHPGQGRVAWFGGRRLWELAFWELPVTGRTSSEQPARRLLRNLLVWIATGTQDAGLALVGHRRVYREGEPVRLEARWHDMRGEPVTGRPLVIRLAAEQPGSGVSTRDYSTKPVPGRPGNAAVELPPLPPGRYTAQPRSVGQPPTIGSPEPLVVTASSLEQSQVRQDTRRLRRLAAAWGGRYSAAADSVAITRLLDELASVDLPSQASRIRQRWDLWADWPLLVVATLLLGTEWFLRRRHGLL